MTITIQFVNEEIGREKILHALRNVKKKHPIFKHLISKVETKDGHLSKYGVKDDEGRAIAECNFEIRENEISFFKLKGEKKLKRDEELEKMLCFHFPEEIDEKAFVSNGKVNTFYDMASFYLIGKDKTYIIHTDWETLMEVEKYRLPLEIRKENKTDNGNQKND